MRRSQGRRKSVFPAKQDVPANTTFDFVADGANWKITLADLQADLGVTGTIEQTGASTGTPILDIQGSANLIRNLEAADDSGISAVVSPENGITLQLDAQADGSGVPVLDTDNHIRHIKAGSGIAAAASNGDIVISATTTPGAGRVVIVDTLADFPTPSGGVIPLSDDTVYFIQDVIDVGVNTFSLAEGTVLTGLSFAVTGITSSGSGYLFENASGFTNEISRMRITAPSCTIFGIPAGGLTANLLLKEISVISCVTIMHADNCEFLRLDGVVATTCSADVFTFGNIIALAVFTNITVFDWTGTVFALGTAGFSRLTIDTGLVISNLGANKVIEGLANSGNIILGGSTGTVGNLDVLNTVTASTNILSTDLRWDFQGNNWIANSIVEALLSLQSNATETVIAIATTPVLVAGTWVVEDENRFTGTTGGRVTYKADRDVTVAITASLTVSPVSGVNRVIGVYVVVNGTFVANSKRTATVSSSGSASITVPWSVSLEKNDYIEMFVANDSGTENIVVPSATLLIS